MDFIDKTSGRGSQFLKISEDISKVMLSVAKLALSCSKQTPTERICMRDAAAEMHRIRDLHVKIR
jgi:hypothetical protein